MKPPMFVRELTPAEREALEAGLCSADAFVVRRCQSLLKSAQKFTPRQIEAQLGWNDESVRRFIRGFNEHGLACLTRRFSCPNSARKLLQEPELRQLGEWLRQNSRDFGLATSR